MVEHVARISLNKNYNGGILIKLFVAKTLTF